MAVYNAIQEKGLNRVLQQRLTMLDSAPAPALVPEIGAQLVLEVDRPEWRRWKGELYWSMYAEIAALAAEYSALWIPPQPGKVVVIEQMRCAGDTVNLGWRTAAPSWTLPFGAYSSYGRDNANASLIGPGAQGGNTAALSPFDNLGGARFDRFVDQDEIDYPIIIWGDRIGGNAFPGLLVRGVTINTAMRVRIRGYIRELLPNELG